MFNLDVFKNSDKRLILLLVIIVLGLVLLLIITLLIFSKPPEKTTVSEPYQNNIRKDEAKISVTDFHLEDPYSKLMDPKHYPLRKPLKKWTKEQINKYFISPRKIITEQFQKINDNSIRGIFHNVK